MTGIGALAVVGAGSMRVGGSPNAPSATTACTRSQGRSPTAAACWKTASRN